MNRKGGDGGKERETKYMIKCWLRNARKRVMLRGGQEWEGMTMKVYEEGNVTGREGERQKQGKLVLGEYRGIDCC